MNSAKTCVITMLILSMVTPGFLFDCLGKSNDPTRPTTHHSFSPFIVDRPVGSKPSAQQKSEPLSFSLNQPYMAGYMTTRYLSEGLGRASARALSVTVSFRGTNKAVIQADNALGAGIAAQGPDRVVGSPGVRPWIDWGYTMLLTLDGDVEYPYILMEVFKAYEWGATGLWPIEPPFYDRVSTCTWALPGVLTINSEVILKMVWNSTCLNYIAFFGGFEYKLYSYTPEPTAWPYFMLGTCYRYHKIFGYLGGTVKWFQFPGAWSEYSIGRTGWHSYIQNPCIIFTEEQGWRYVDFAYSVDGPNSFMDNTLGWGGETYWGVNATYSLHYIHFYPTSNGVTLPLDTLLWHTRDPQDAGCPFVYSWIRNQYVEDNNILPQSERGERIDIKDYYRLEQPPEATMHNFLYSKYLLQIREFENEHSFIDQIKLYAVDHDDIINVAVTPEGKTVTYHEPLGPLEVKNSREEDVLTQLSNIDGNYYEGFKDDYLLLNLGRVKSENAKLIMRTDNPPMKRSIHVQIPSGNGSWTDIAAIIPRTHWATDAIDLSSYLPEASTDLIVRLYFTADHKIDYVGLDTTPQEEIIQIRALLYSASHSIGGSVQDRLLFNDQQYVELLPGQEVTLTFVLPRCLGQKRTFILYTEGYYYSIIA